jgi:hypothetical protein
MDSETTEENVADDFLEGLLGSWNLTGTMGDIQLLQKVDARWVIQGEFLQMHFRQTNPAPEQQPYEAMYMIGQDSKAGQYIMHLFDTFGAGFSRTIGIGTRKGDAVEFIFDYPAGRFSNTFTRDRTFGKWEMLLRQLEDGGGWKIFATKNLSRD